MELVQKKTELKPKPADVPAIPAASPDAAEQAAASVDKIRDILFGPQIKNYEARFARLEETVARESADLKDTMKRRFESLEEFFRKETEALSTRVKAERDERTEAIRGIARDLKSATEGLARKIQDLDSKTADAQSGLRHDLMAESRKLLEEIRRRSDDLTALLERRAGELRHEKADRAALAALLADMAVQLTDGLDVGQKAKTAKAAKEA